MRAFVLLAVTLFASCAGGPALVTPVAAPLTTANVLHDDDPADAQGRIIGILSAVARTNNAALLPRARKIELLPLFGLAPPDSERAIDLLARIELAAEAAGHPVKREGRSFADRERSAWAGAREGFADRLRALADPLQTSELKRAALATAARLDVELRAEVEAGSTPVPSEGHALVIAAASCWLGRTWGDGAWRRCEALALGVYGEPEHAYEMSDALRAAEPNARNDLAVKAGRFAPMARAIGAAVVDARKIPALIDMRGETGAIGWLLALDRLEAASERPPHEEADLAATVFRVSRQASWLDTFERVAKSVGYPLLPSDLVKDDSDFSDAAIQRLLRASVNEGIADRLRPMADESDSLGAAIHGAVDRVDAEYRQARKDFAR
jgi:hypothetical protein